MTIPERPTKPVWPYPHITILTPAPNGQFMKKWKGKPYYFGVWDDPESALQRWRTEWPLITSGRAHERQNSPKSAIGLVELCTLFLEAKERAVGRGDLVYRTFQTYKSTTKQLIRILGDKPVANLGPTHFSKVMEKLKSGPTNRGNFVVYTKTLFRWGVKQGLIDEVDYGPDFRGPPIKVKRRIRRAQGQKRFDAATIRCLIAMADPTMKAILWLGINGGFGNNDVAMLPADAFDLDKALIDHVRYKTEVQRTVPLWPETVQAVKKVIQPDGLALLTPEGKPLVRRGTDEITDATRALLKQLGIWEKGMGYYWLRRTFATVAAETGDKDAAKRIMGHDLSEVHDLYVQGFPLKRLVRVSNHVRHWLLSSP